MARASNSDTRKRLAKSYRDVRRTSVAMREFLSEEDCAIQSMPDASPVKWHLAHTSWFFETFVLEAAAPDYTPFCPHYRTLFNSYYNAVGEQYPRPRRGMLSRPPLTEILAYREAVDEHVLNLLASDQLDARALAVVELGLHHEQQHQELLLTDVKHMLACNPLFPAYRDLEESRPGEVKPLAWHARKGGVHSIGKRESGFAFDNEGPRHRVFVEDFEIASRPVTNGEFLAFMGDCGYSRPELWLADGWARCSQEGWEAPLYWTRQRDQWCVQTLSGLRTVREDEPVTHISYYEADAYASWACARLPCAAEWEICAEPLAVEGNFVESGWLHPVPARGDGDAPLQMFGDVWEWTRTAYAGYPGYSAGPGALGEYNGKFMCDQYVLRGGSCASPQSHLRAEYRNFFPASARWQFSGIRLARDLG
jgi:ergothioneine biosynthesis protein EgtB